MIWPGDPAHGIVTKTIHKMMSGVYKAKGGGRFMRVGYDDCLVWILFQCNIITLNERKNYEMCYTYNCFEVSIKLIWYFTAKSQNYIKMQKFPLVHFPKIWNFSLWMLIYLNMPSCRSRSSPFDTQVPNTCAALLLL